MMSKYKKAGSLSQLFIGILFFVPMLFSATVLAEGFDSIQVIEYFIDTDPGLGNGIILESDSSPAYICNDVIDLSSLSVGIHTIWFRVQDIHGQWGAPYGKSFYVYRPLETDTANIPLVKLQYSLNNVDNFAPVEIIEKDTLASTMKLIDQLELTAGIHSIWFRTEDSTGFYSAPYGKSFNVYRPLETDTANIPLVKLQYSLNNVDNFAPVEIIEKDTLASTMKLIDQSELTAGIHSIWFRTEDSTGFYSAPYAKSFYVFEKTLHDSLNMHINNIEYSFDSISGFTSLGTFDPDTEVSLNVDLLESLIGQGEHTIFLRAKDTRDFYSAVVARNLVFENETPVANAGENRFVGETSQVTLDGSASFDANKDLLSYHWTAPPGIVLSSNDVAQPTFNTPAIESDTVLSFILYVSDGLENSTNDTVRIVVIHNEMAISDTTLSNIVADCINAFDNISVAGDGELVIFDTGSVNTLIAGQSIRFLHGFHARSGSYVNAYITNNAWYCDDILQPIVAASPAVEKSINAEHSPENDEFSNGTQSMKVYPNPNNGIFTLQFANIENNTRVIIFNTLGQKVYETIVNGETHQVELPNIQRGIYLVKAINDKEQFDRKVLVQ